MVSSMRARRKRTLHLISASYLVSLKGIKIYCPRIEMKPGLQNYAKSVTMKTSENHLKRTFVYILTLSSILFIQLKGTFRNKTQNFARQSLQKNVLQQLCGDWQLDNSHRSTGKTFGVAKSTTVSITHAFCEELSSHAADFIKFPLSRKESAEAISKFREYSSCKIPQTVGAIDGIHIGIKAP